MLDSLSSFQGPRRSGPQPPTADRMPDCRSGLYRELVVEPERAAAPVIELRDPAPDRSQVWGWVWGAPRCDRSDCG